MLTILAVTGFGRSPGVITDQAISMLGPNRTVIVLGVLGAIAYLAHRVGLTSGLRALVGKWTLAITDSIPSPSTVTVAETVQESDDATSDEVSKDPEELADYYRTAIRRFSNEAVTSLLHGVVPDEGRRADLALPPVSEQPTARKPVTVDQPESTVREASKPELSVGAENAKVVAPVASSPAYFDEVPFDAYVEYAESEMDPGQAEYEDFQPQTAPAASSREAQSVSYTELFGVESIS